MADDRPRDAVESPTVGQRLRRGGGLVGFALRRLVARSRRTAARELLSTVCLVGLAVALLIVVTGISLALADDAAVTGEAADLRVVPADQSSLSPVVAAEQPRLGAVHTRAARIESHAGVTAATPVLLDGVRLRAPGSGEPVEVLAIGVVPGPQSPPVAGLATQQLGTGDPQYANGTYDGPFTGDVLLSTAAAAQLNASTGDPLLLQSRAGPASEEFTVTATDGGAQPSGGLPIAVFRLSELQTVAGAADGDLGSQILVVTAGDPGAVQRDLETRDPNTSVVSTGGLTATANTLRGDTLALALSTTASLVGIVLCALVVTTTMGMTITADRQRLAVLTALGFDRRARLTIVATTVFGLTLAGGAVGLGFGLAGIWLTNAVAQATVTTAPIATVGMWVLPYAGGVALLAGGLAVPYPLVLAARTPLLTELHQ